MFSAKSIPTARMSRTEETLALGPITVLAMRFVKKPFTTPEDGDPNVTGAGRRNGKMSNCPEFRWLDLTAASCGKYRAAEFRSCLITYRSKWIGASAASAIPQKICGERPRS
jgi:hypothetical protein